MRGKVTLVEAIHSLYTKAVEERTTTSTLRLRKLAEYCVQKLAERGLEGAEIDVEIPGGGRAKRWDVAWKFHSKYRLAISLKSILSNLSGTVPNRIDDLIGEVANVQMYSPEIVIGYVMVFDVSKDTKPSKKHGMKWLELLRHRLEALSGRKAPHWSIGMIEAFSIIEVDFSKGPKLLTKEEELAEMFDLLVQEVRKRNPSVGRMREDGD